MKEIQKLSETEQEIMKLVWKMEPPVTASEVQQQANTIKSWKYTTVATFMQNLCQKGILRVVKKGHTNLYYPQITEDEYLQIETKAFLERVHHGSVKSFMSALCGRESNLLLDDATIMELKEMIKKL